MKQYMDTLCGCTLFAGIAKRNMDDAITCLNGTVSHFSKGKVLILSGSMISQIGVILSGNAQVVQEDFSGNQNIVAKLSPCDLFAETFVCAGVSVSPVSVIATSDCTALFLNYHKIITMCEKTCTFHQTLIENMTKILAMKNLNLNQKIEILSKKTIREKLLAYLHWEARRAGQNKFTISFSRQEVADFLCVDRSALSRELSNMKKEQILTFRQHEFEIYGFHFH